ncbi:RICIN domain-containing protein [Streptomyces sp. ET3-23]|uniref:RICIN domain-containing protein n=1 Tax=Streptomyces sp. ET3-23 TaxID=2885643 RepID=UPI001D10A212|nr:RICIN domain-containing protein [Streptomyces sp. ET3-23]MCC2279769.1 RICIN domain-containing protein [Streptomyces sp. ET3-23]
MKRSARFGAAAASALFAVIALPNVSEAANPDTLVQNSTLWGRTKCLEIENSSSDNGARAQIWDCNGQPGSVWRFNRNSDGSYYIVNNASGKCLEIADSRKGNGAPAQQWSCTGIATQRWWFGGGHIFNANSGKVLETNNGDSSNGAGVQQWTKSDSDPLYQQWSYGHD